MINITFVPTCNTPLNKAQDFEKVVFPLNLSRMYILFPKLSFNSERERELVFNSLHLIKGIVVKKLTCNNLTPPLGFNLTTWLGCHNCYS